MFNLKVFYTFLEYNFKQKPEAFLLRSCLNSAEGYAYAGSDCTLKLNANAPF